jgi:hypothetical protein
MADSPVRIAMCHWREQRKGEGEGEGKSQYG